MGVERTQYLSSCIDHYFTIILFESFNIDKIPQITVHCRKANSGLFALSACPVDWSLISIMSSGKDQSPNSVGLYHFLIYLYMRSNLVGGRLSGSFISKEVIDTVHEKILKNQIWDKVRNVLKNKKNSFMAREDLNSKVIIIKEHQWKFTHTPLSQWWGYQPSVRANWSNLSNPSTCNPWWATFR